MVRDVADVVDGESQSLKLRQSAQSENGNLRQDVIIQPQVMQRRQAFKGGGRQVGEEVRIQTSGSEKQEEIKHCWTQEVEHLR